MAKRILIADDSVTIQKAFAMTFAGADDMTVASARSADEALSMAQKLQPDLILADGVMPGRTGYDLCASVRGDPSLRATPVYILASSQQPYDDGRGQQVGATGHFIKPWDTSAILERLREAVRGGLAGLAPAAPPVRSTAASLPAAAIEDEEYGEISIDSGRDTAPEPRARVATPPPPAPVPGRMTSPSMPTATGGTSPGMRPSLIPGMRPGTMPPVRPGTAPVRPQAGPAPGPATAPPRPAAAPVGRTLMGLPAANLGGFRPTPPAAPSIAHAPPGMSPPMRPPTAPVAPLQARGGTAPHAPTAYAPAPAPAPASAAAAVSATVDQKLAAFAAKGPEYEAIAKLSREVIEQIVWEVVPDLAEAIIREQVAKRGV